jgi:hypothetical protein
MSILRELAKEISEYPKNHVEIEVSDVKYGGEVLDIGDRENFLYFTISNKSHLNMLSVKVHVEVLDDFVELRDKGVWGAPELDLHVGDIKAHDYKEDLGPITFRPRRSTTGKTDLISIQIADWTADLSHLLAVHSATGTGTIYREHIIQT